jgi:alkylation response protein AidB-like acyl-CoA dehydrogenase
MAKSEASDAGAFISDRSVQLHGGIGFTWECDVHIFFKRSMHTTRRSTARRRLPAKQAGRDDDREDLKRDP